MERKGICKNVGVCSKVDKVQVITDDDAEFICSECHEPLEPVKEDEKKQDNDPKKKKLPIIIAAAVAVIGGSLVAIFGFPKENTGGDGTNFTVSINKYELAMNEGDSDTLRVTCLPADPGMAVQYASDNESVAIVTSSGVVHAAGKGDAIIRVTSQLTNDKKDTFLVSVNVAKKVTVKIEKDKLSLKKGGKETIKVECQPEDADVTLSFASDNQNVAKVTSDGVVSAVGKGNGTVRVTAKSAEDKTDTFLVKVNVSDNGPGPVDLVWGKYSGPRNTAGKPHGTGGTIKVKTRYSIDLKDGRGGTLQVYPGETIVNTKFVNGHLRQGELHRNDGTRKWFNI